MDFKHLSGLLNVAGLEDDAVWWGVVSIPFFALLTIGSGIMQLRCLFKRTVESPQFWKFSIFLLGETAGFLFPYYYITDYTKKVELIIEYGPHGQYNVFYLLLVNPVTILLGIYEFISFLVLYFHNHLNKERAELKENITKLKKSSDGASGAENGIQHEIYGNGKTASQPIYPQMDLASMMNELQNLPTYSKSPTSTPLAKGSEQGGRGSGHNFDKEAAVTFTSLVSYRNDQVAIKRTERIETAFHEMRNFLSFGFGNLYEDSEFPANSTSLGENTRVQWKRPHEITPGAKFFTDGVSRFDVRQGELGDCWFLAALANLTLNNALFSRVVPSDNEWATGKYTGMCHFNFFKDGKWVEVIIDDRLPTRNGQLIYMSSSDPSEFWSALVEKAFAKLYGSYKNLDGNDGIGPAMINLTGGRVKRYAIQDFVRNLQKLFDMMANALDKGKMVGCCCNSMGEDSGIVGGHAYSVTSVAKIQFRTGLKVSCLRIRNPWGCSQEWAGKFADGHPIWDLVEPKVKKELKIMFNDDGEFWFPMDQLMSYFHFIEICHCAE